MLPALSCAASTYEITLSSQLMVEAQEVALRAGYHEHVLAGTTKS